MVDSIRTIVESGLCISCGACAAVSHDAQIEMAYIPDRGLYLPKVRPGTSASRGDLPFDVCPGKGYPIAGLARRRLSGEEFYDMELGYWNGMWAARTSDRKVSASASSGGVMTAIAAELLKRDLVQGVVVTSLEHTPDGPRPRTSIVRDFAGLLRAQGSKYCPVPACEVFREAECFDGQLAFVGTPCHIASLRLLQQYAHWAEERFPFAIGNFCGGFRDLRQTDALIERYGFDAGRVVRFRYRGGGQPGSLLIEDADGRVFERAYPAYMRDTGYAKTERCRLCCDATAELADFSCGDAWIPRFLESGESWSLLMTRTPPAKALVEKMASAGRLALSEVTKEELRESQRSNLTSKKRRQHSRRRLHRMLGRRVPEFDGGFATRSGSLLFEAFVAAHHYVSERGERSTIFKAISAILEAARAAGRTVRNRARPRQNTAKA